MSSKLGELNEMVGTLVDVTNKNGCMNLIFGISKKIDLPISAISKEKLQGYLGKRIGILNLDGDYRIREIREKEK